MYMKWYILLICICVCVTSATKCSISCHHSTKSKCSVECQYDSYCYCMESQAKCVCLNRNETKIRNESKCSCYENQEHKVPQKSGCSNEYQPCKSTSDCCYVCTGVICYSGYCQPNMCYGTGVSCDADCQCCSGDCNKSDLDPGNCT